MVEAQLTSLTEPRALQARPHHGGLPIPFVTAIIDGVPDFRVHNEAARQRCAVQGLCQLCGTGIDGRAVLIGFVGSVERNSFGEPPMHVECFTYAWEVCPWLNGRGYQARERDDGVDDVSWAERPTTATDDPMGVVHASRWHVSMDRLGQLVWHVDDPHTRYGEIEWRRRG